MRFTPSLLLPALMAAGLLAIACSRSSGDAPPSPSPHEVDSDARDADAPNDAGSVSDAGGTIRSPPQDAAPPPPVYDASALTCPGPSFDASASVGAGVAGLYTSCALFSGGGVWMGNGFGASVTLRIAQSDAGVTATYTYEDAGEGTLAFHATSSTSATLAPALQTVGTRAFEVCDVGAGAPFPATLTVASGAITYDAHTVFLSLLGVNAPTVAPVAPCSTEQGEGTLSILCTQGDDAGAPAGDPPAPSGPASGAGFVPGRYACSSVTGGSHFVSAGSGTMTLARAGGSVTVAYSDPQLSGTLQFAATSDTTADPVDQGQTPSLTWAAPPSSAPSQLLEVSAASLSTECGTLFLAVGGTVEGATVAATVTCAPP